MLSSSTIIQKLSDPVITNDLIDKHLILFFDINGTVMASDSSRDKETDAAIWQLLAENYSAQWTINTEVMTFRKYVENVLCPGDGKNDDIKKSRLEHYRKFVDFLKINHHPLCSEIEATFHKIKNSLKNSDIFPSFFNLVDYLNKNNFKYTIIFRTFGNDLDKVIKEVSEKTSIGFGKRASFNMGELHIDDRILTTPAEMLQSIKPFEHGGWQDQWKYWHERDEKYDAGKSYPIDLSNEKVVSIFFDDNALDKQILGVKPITNETLDQRKIQKELIRLGRIVPVNTLTAILEENYFIDRINFALDTRLILKKQNETIARTTNEIKRPASPVGLLYVTPPSVTTTNNMDQNSQLNPSKRQKL